MRQARLQMTFQYWYELSLLANCGSLSDEFRAALERNWSQISTAYDNSRRQSNF